mmetsp:Transcript_11945/g.21871  ORF Transcript_11945/g.21871 Transcript_11945/m.21871 type:complete len:206 (+) Transcript_11945:827-1444(+)
MWMVRMKAQRRPSGRCKASSMTSHAALLGRHPSPTRPMRLMAPLRRVGLWNSWKVPVIIVLWQPCFKGCLLARAVEGQGGQAAARLSSYQALEDCLADLAKAVAGVPLPRARAGARRAGASPAGVLIQDVDETLGQRRSHKRKQQQQRSREVCSTTRKSRLSWLWALCPIHRWLRICCRHMMVTLQLLWQCSWLPRVVPDRAQQS